MDKPISIPKTMSSPADPSEPSFLTTLPAELRNAVYEILFKRDEPVLVHNAAAYHAKRPSRDDVGSAEHYQARLALYEETFEQEIGKDSESVHTFYQGLNLLRSCRQIYYEAASVLYGSNTFIITRVLDRHDTGDHRILHDSHGYSQSNYAPQWLASIGTQVELLNEVLIEVDATCPGACDLEPETYDILPLRLIMWRSTKL